MTVSKLEKILKIDFVKNFLMGQIFKYLAIVIMIFKIVIVKSVLDYILTLLYLLFNFKIYIFTEFILITQKK